MGSSKLVFLLVTVQAVAMSARHFKKHTGICNTLQSAFSSHVMFVYRCWIIPPKQEHPIKPEQADFQFTVTDGIEISFRSSCLPVLVLFHVSRCMRDQNSIT